MSITLQAALYQRDGRSFLLVNGQERDVTGWRQVTVSITQDGVAWVSLDGDGGGEVWVVEPGAARRAGMG